MFSGKTEELIRRLKRAKIADQSLEIFKPAKDTRYSANDVVSHDAHVLSSRPVHSSEEILSVDPAVQVIGIDEAQFFDQKLPSVCEELAERGHRVIVAGLDMDFRGRPFGPMPLLLAKAEYATKVHAICVVCGNLASYSFRKSQEKSQVLLGEKDLYEPRCRACFLEGMKQ